MKSADGLFTLLSSIVALAVVTTLVLPGRGTGNVIWRFFQGFASAIRAAMGKAA